RYKLSTLTGRHEGNIPLELNLVLAEEKVEIVEADLHGGHALAEHVTHSGTGGITRSTSVNAPHIVEHPEVVNHRLVSNQRFCHLLVVPVASASAYKAAHVLRVVWRWLNPRE